MREVIMMEMPNKGTTFLFQGDSITDGGRGRTDDMNHILGHGYVYLISATLGEKYAEQEYRFMNKGNSGDRSVDVYARFEEDTLELKPDVVSLMIGTNDVGEYFFNFSPKCGINAEKYEKIYKIMIEEIRRKLPQSEIVMCEPFVLPVGRVKENWEEWWPKVNEIQQIVRHLATENNAIFVPLQYEFDQCCTRAKADYWIWDGIHPTPWGHSVIAKAWLKAVFPNEDWKI